MSKLRKVVGRGSRFTIGRSLRKKIRYDSDFRFTRRAGPQEFLEFIQGFLGEVNLSDLWELLPSDRPGEGSSLSLVQHP